jgi:hypothetical protein
MTVQEICGQRISAPTIPKQLLTCIVISYYIACVPLLVWDK